MIEEGLVKLLQADAAVQGLAPVGGFLGVLPKDTALPSWTHLVVNGPGSYTLTGRQSLRKRLTQIDCFADDPDDVINLAKAIDTVLDGYKGILTDSDSTVVQGCFRSDLIDFFDPPARSFRRMLEYEIWFVE